MLNRVMIIGRLGQDPQLKYSQGGMPIATFSVATDETFIDREGNRQQRTEWFRVVVFQKVAENCSRFLRKGSLVYVEGSLQTRKWQDQEGKDHTLVEIRAQRVDFLEKRQPQDEFGGRRYEHGEGGEGYGGYEADAQRQQQPSYQRTQQPAYQSTATADTGRSPVFPQDAEQIQPHPSEQSYAGGEGSAGQTGESDSKMDTVPF